MSDVEKVRMDVLSEMMENLQQTMKTTLEGCHLLVQIDEEQDKRMDDLGSRIDLANERINIVNKRLRKLEQHYEKLLKLINVNSTICNNRAFGGGAEK